MGKGSYVRTVPAGDQPAQLAAAAHLEAHATEAPRVELTVRVVMTSVGAAQWLRALPDTAQPLEISLRKCPECPTP